jgi:predicted peptidase
MNSNLSALFGTLFSSVPIAGGQGEIVERVVRVGTEDFIYQIYVPPTKAGEKLPVVVFLHGIRERGCGGYISGMFAQIVRQYLRKIPTIVLFPQCQPTKYWSDETMEAMVWRSIEQTFDEFVADENRIYLIGVSMGGYGVWHFAARYPQKFAALVSICGGSPIISGERFAPIAEKVGQTPAWIFHGAADRIVPVSESRELVKALQAAKANVKYSEYKNVGHNVWLNALSEKELLPWLLAQARKKKN